ncbi:RNA-binding domain-containing protein, partial [Rhodotorula sp. JG-1b]
MNQIRHIQKLNEEELKSGTTASWHDQYKDSAYVNVGGLPINLTEGDVITIFSQYGEIVDINMPRDPNTGKPRGFAWLMYADQRSTVLAVDNLNGAQVLGRTLRVDHVLNYKQLERDQETGKLKERDEQSFAAHPEKFLKKESDGPESDSSHGSIDPDDPMRDYLISQRREKKEKRKAEGE